MRPEAGSLPAASTRVPTTAARIVDRSTSLTCTRSGESRTVVDPASRRDSGCGSTELAGLDLHRTHHAMTTRMEPD